MRALVALSGVCLGGWADAEPNKQVGREVEMKAGKHENSEEKSH